MGDNQLGDTHRSCSPPTGANGTCAVVGEAHGVEPMLNEQFWSRYKDVSREEDGKRLQELYAKF